MVKFINLNKKYITKTELMRFITDYEIYCMYCDFDAIHNKGIGKSPLREKDDKHSFGFFIGENNEICFNDFVLGKGDCIRFVEKMFGLSHFEALSKIAIDANLDGYFIVKNTFKTNVNTSNVSKTRKEIMQELNQSYLGKTSRPMQLFDYVFWNKFNINKSTLEQYRVQAIDYIHVGIDKKIIKTDKYAYCFIEFKDGKETYKIYQPFSTNYKWLSSHNESIWQGFQQLPPKGDILIITKSLKDVMSIKNTIGIPAVALQSESMTPKESVIEQLKNRFKKIFILYDNDFDKEQNWGRIFGKKLADKFNFIQIEIDEEYKSKDFSDLVMNYGTKIATEHLLELIEEKPF